MPLCRHHPARQCFCPVSLVKMRRGANRPLTVDTIQSQWKLSPVDLGENWPSLLNQFRLSGNRRFNPISYFSPTFTSFEDASIEQLAWDYIASRCAILEEQSRFGDVPPVSGFDYANVLFRAFNEAELLYRQGLNADCVELLEDCLKLFERICTRLSPVRDQSRLGFGKGIYMEVIEMARLFAPLITELCSPWMYSILESLYKMTEHDDGTLRRILLAISPTDQDVIFNMAWVDYQAQNSILAFHILKILQ